nr:Chain C, iCAL50 peptide [synthetic construct]4E35_D Chain D, iCAL50 peptide [synthetic construct]4E3B_C Chain C, iCAL50 peptide [synthetic construct]4E3B_D Chain D, iCAL50 peptide [synthetic construct]
ANSRWPTSIL